MPKKKQSKHTSPEKLAKTQELRKMMQNPLAEKLKELTEMLEPLKEKMLLEDAAQKMGISEAGIKTIRESTINDIDIFSETSETKGAKKIWYIKIKKKQP